MRPVHLYFWNVYGRPSWQEELAGYVEQYLNRHDPPAILWVDPVYEATVREELEEELTEKGITIKPSGSVLPAHAKLEPLHYG